MLSLIRTETRLGRSAALDDDRGFGLIEIVVSMFVLAALSLAFIPLLAQGLKLSAENTTLATANQLVNEQLALVQEAGPYCDAVQVLVGESDTVDPRGVTIRITTVIESCPTSAAGTVRASVTAERMDTGDTIVSAATLVYVTT